MRLAGRLALGAVALLACAFFALSIHQNDALSAASAVASASHPSAAAAARAEQDLNSAATLNPDRTVQVTRAQLALDRGRTARARSILRSVVRDEPQNLDAWILLVRASANDRPERAVAFAKALALSNSKLP